MDGVDEQYLGTVRVDISSIRFEVLDSENDLTNSLNPLITAYTFECERDRPENYASGLLDSTTYTNAILENGHLKLPPKSILCLEGRKRILAAKEFLPKDDQWWTIRLYSDELDQQGRLFLRNNNSTTIGDSDAEIYRRIVYFQANINQKQERIWKSKLSASKRKRLEQFLRKPQYAAALNKLLPIVGLWKSFSLGHFNRLNPMRCEEEIICYLDRIWKVWAFILNDCIVDMKNTDASTVQYLQGRSPGHSQSDAVLVTDLMGKGKIFGGVQPSSKVGILERLLRVDLLIPSIFTFFEDLKYLEVCASVLQRLI
ncbi:hypothetical protein K440DRAFT_601988, partial [Wilcoxina mikolae CBS 423.85]